MKSALVEQAVKVIQDPAVLINVVSKRVKQLTDGYSQLVPSPGPDYGEADIALMEIIAGKVKEADGEPVEA